MGIKLVVGLGNPGAEYARTPHNVGFMAVAKIAERIGCRLKRSLRFRSLIGTGEWQGVSLLLLQPETFMNLSGEAVGKVVSYRRVALEDIVLVLDDADLDFGRLRVRSRGGSGGHRGLASVIGRLGTDEFARVRIGIGRRADAQDLVEHVLRPFEPEQAVQLDGVIDRAADAVLGVAASGVVQAMNRFNAAE
ncbi:MAG: aminoacyl-tRNA hydrolase [Lentisphaerae bacterium]|nr:aminoacyl-tRNA hydrolase [Lentisphaerota bacterium]